MGVRHDEDFERELLLRLEPLFERLVPETGLPSPGKLKKNFFGPNHVKPVLPPLLEKSRKDVLALKDIGVR